MASASIHVKLSKVMSEVTRIPKKGYNDFHKYHYALESDLMDHIRPIFAENQIGFFSTVLEQEKTGEFTKVKIEYTLTDLETGEQLKSVYWGEGQDRGDKGLYKAYAGATKYFLMKTFLIATGDDPEADTSTDERNKPAETSLKPSIQEKWNSLGYEKSGFEDWYKKQQEKKFTEKQMLTYLNKKTKEKRNAS